MYFPSRKALPVLAALLSYGSTSAFARNQVTLNLTGADFVALTIENVPGNRTSLTFQATEDSGNPYLLVGTSARENAVDQGWKAGKGEFRWTWLQGHGDLLSNPPIPMTYTTESFPCHLVGTPTDPDQDITFPIVVAWGGGEQMEPYNCKARNGVHLLCKDRKGKDWPMYCSENGSMG